ncbi:MAG: tRNA 2-thiocytidine biosynthesis TtcA family protein [Christensenellales bacterium]
MKKVLGCIRRADKDWNMITHGDSIAIDVSGGKDSMLMLHALSLYRMFSHVDYRIHAVTLDMGMDGFDSSPIAEYADKLNIPFTLVKTGIYDEVFIKHGGKNPCSLCARMRRGILHKTAKKLGCSKVALAHSSDDVIETLLLGVFQESRMHVFRPVTYLDRSDLTLIRPLVYLSEQHIKKTVARLGLPIVHNPCPANGHTRRQDMKELLNKLSATIPDCRERLLGALKNDEAYCLWNRTHEE